MTASLRRTVAVVVAALVVAATLVLAASSVPAPLVGERQDAPAQADRVSEPEPAPEADTPEQAGRDEAPPRAATTLAAWVHDLLAFALLAAGLLVVTSLLRALVVRLVQHLPDQQLVVDLEPLPDLDVARAAVRGDRDRHRQALADGDARNGIVACWVLLEEAAAAAGVARDPSETATELVVRFLHALDVDPRPVASLAGLFHEARFSTHPLGPEARVRAEEALEAIHLDLERSAVR